MVSVRSFVVKLLENQLNKHLLPWTLHWSMEMDGFLSALSDSLSDFWCFAVIMCRRMCVKPPFAMLKFDEQILQNTSLSVLFLCFRINGNFFCSDLLKTHSRRCLLDILKLIFEFNLNTAIFNRQKSTTKTHVEYSCIEFVNRERRTEMTYVWIVQHENECVRWIYSSQIYSLNCIFFKKITAMLWINFLATN